MSVTVGIDLGTTNSCVAVHRDTEIRNREELIEADRLVVVGNALVIAGPPGPSPITPSAVWIGTDGKVVVGQEAVQYSSLPGEPPPATMFKRSMGWDSTVAAGHRRITPTEASTHVLAHLKRLAEDVLGVPVERAVVTVPAHFETTAKNATTDAARAAGLDVVTTLIEPVAGALAYVDQDAVRSGDGTRTFLVYDLGGGTFDVSVVVWDGADAFDLRATDGDRFLGGYEFDKALLRWVVAESTAYDLAFDETVPEEAASRVKLLRHTERMKIELTNGTLTTLLDQHTVDRTGTVVNLRLTIDRGRFEGLIGGDVQTSMQITERLAAKVGLGPDDIDEVVLVGGSARIPMIKKMLRKQWSRAPWELDPDLCVAAGAALLTARLDDVSEQLKVGKPDVADGLMDLRGEVLPGPVGRVDGRLIELAAEDGSLSRRTHSDAVGRFSFQEVELAEGANELVVRLLDDGRAVDTYQFTVTRDAPVAPPPDPVLARTFSVRTRSGLLTVVEGGQVTVPHTAQVHLATANRGTTLVVAVYEGDTAIGELRIGGLSRDLPVGTPVDVDLLFTADWRIEAEARVPSVSARGSARMSVQAPEIQGWEELARRLVAAGALWEEQRDLLTRAQALEHGPVIGGLTDEVDQLLGGRDDLVKANARLCSLENALRRLPRAVVLEPPWADFDAALEELGLRCDVLSAHRPEAAERYRREIPTLRAAGENAYRNEDQRTWVTAVNSVYSKLRALDDMMRVGPPVDVAPDPASRLASIRREIDDACRDVQRDGAGPGSDRGDESSRLLDMGSELRALVESVELGDRDAVDRLNRIRGNEVQRWLAEVAVHLRTEDIGVDPR